MSELVELNKIEAKIVMSKVVNGYIVSRRKANAEEPSGVAAMLGASPEVEDFVFSNLADVVKFLGEHYKEPTVGL